MKQRKQNTSELFHSIINLIVKLLDPLNTVSSCQNPDKWKWTKFFSQNSQPKIYPIYVHWNVHSSIHLGKSELVLHQIVLRIKPSENCYLGETQAEKTSQLVESLYLQVNGSWKQELLHRLLMLQTSTCLFLQIEGCSYLGTFLRKY